MIIVILGVAFLVAYWVVFRGAVLRAFDYNEVAYKAVGACLSIAAVVLMSTAFDKPYQPVTAEDYAELCPQLDAALRNDQDLREILPPSAWLSADWCEEAR